MAQIRLPLSGIRVIDLSRLLPGPFCSMILGDLGAEVIRVEEPGYDLGAPPPFYQKDKYTESAFNSLLMHNKKSITLNLKKERSKQILAELIQNADIFLETYRPGVAKKLGIDYDSVKKLNPSIIYCSLTGYGQTGPYSLRPGHDMNYLALCGLLDLNRPHPLDKNSKDHIAPSPVVPYVQAADISGSLYAVIGILAALFERMQNPNKEGQNVDVGMLDCGFTLNPMVAAYVFSKYTDIENALHGEMPFYSIFKTKDGKDLAIGAIEGKFWQELCNAMGLPELRLKQYTTPKKREDTFEKLQAAFLQKTEEDWMAIFDQVDTCVSPIRTFSEAVHDPQLKARGMIQEVDHPELGSIKLISSPVKLSRTPLNHYHRAPKIGENTDEILESLGYTKEQILDLRNGGVI